MRSGTPSRTAQFVAFQRALGTLAPQVPGFSDPLARQFLTQELQRRIDRAARSSATRSVYPFWFRGMALFNQFRTVVLDRAIAQSMPMEQLVILGAGLDSRAWRMDCLKDTTVFEVDHPDTQAWKRKQAAGLPPKAKAVHFVATDFQQRTLAPLLLQAGYDPSKPAFWLWEGVTMYLTRADVSANLATFSSISVPGSRLALTYLRKDNGRAPKSLFLTLVREPVRSAFAPGEMSDLAREHRWIKSSDTSIEDWLPELAPGLSLTRRQVRLQWFESIWIGDAT